VKNKSLILKPGSSHSLEELGGKAWALNQLAEAEFSIPDWFVVTPAFFYAVMDNSGYGNLLSLEGLAELRDKLLNIELDSNLQAQLNQAIKSLSSENQKFAVRSSAVDEDSSLFSFAGQLESYLFVLPEQILGKLCAVWRSGFSERIVEYRSRNGLIPLPSPPAVIIQKMVDADASGVAFSADPTTGQRSVVVVNAVFGLADALVSGEVEGDVHRVQQQQIIERAIAEKPTAQRQSQHGGIKTEPLSNEQKANAVLNNDSVLKITQLVKKAERLFDRPQDIEWAIEDEKLYLLQSRPITTLQNMPDPDGDVIIWDNSNIVESYSGVTTPLTFTFIRRAYEAVYLELVKILGVPESLISEKRHVFANMLGLIKGRVYYNLLSWYRALALLPGFSLNRGFMEQMMGVKEELPASVLAPDKPLTTMGRIKDLIRLGSTVVGLGFSYFKLNKKIAAFYQRLDDTLQNPEVPIESMRADQLVNDYHRLEQHLLTRWDAPLINDLFAMIFYGLLKKLVSKWCNDEDGTLQNNLLINEGGMISAEPAHRVKQMARIACDNKSFVAVLVGGSLKECRAAIESHQEFSQHYSDYLQKFGDRCLEELKLESTTLNDDPLLLIRSIGFLAQQGEQSASEASGKNTLRQQAEEIVQARLQSSLLRRKVFSWVLDNARQRVRDRENLRFERTRVFGQVRRIFVELGKRFYAQDMLHDPRDIFYLELQEILGAVEGTSSSLSFKGIAAVRKQEYEEYRAASAPDERFVTRGGVYLGNTFKGKKQPEIVSAGGIKGIGCCPGVARGIARVITDPRNAELQPGQILIAKHTDPGWIMLFASAAGVIVERGSLLSHSAIVAREMNIPAIVSVNNVMHLISDGDEIEMDGASGIVNVVKTTAREES